jgi:hypothetical protein
MGATLNTHLSAGRESRASVVEPMSDRRQEPLPVVKFLVVAARRLGEAQERGVLGHLSNGQHLPR